MVRERHEWEATKGPIKIKEIGIDTETSSQTQANDERKEDGPERAVV